MPRIKPLHDVDHLMRLLIWGRQKGIRFGPTVQIGELIVQVNDVRQAKTEGMGRGMDTSDGDADILAEHGAGEAPADGTEG